MEKNTKFFVTTYKIDLLIVAIYILIPILFFSSVLMADTAMVRGDGLGYMAANDMIKRSIVEGEIPLWNRFNASGNAFMADIQNKFFYPLMWVMLIFPLKLGFKLYFTTHLTFAAVFMYMYLRNFKVSKGVAFFGGIIIMFSNILIIRYEHINIMNSIVWVPLLLLLVEKLVAKQENKYAILLGVAMAFQFLGGFPQTAVYTDIFVFIYYIIISYNKDLKINQLVKRIIKQTSIFAMVYIGLICIQVIPLIELMMFSGRSDISYDFFASYAYDLRMLASMLFPTYWGEWGSNLQTAIEFPTDLYIGIVPLCLMIYGIIFHKNKNRIKLLIGTIIGTFLFACSPQIPLLGKIIYRIPIIGSFRVQSRILFIFVIAAITLGMLTLDYIIKNKEFKRYFKFSIIMLIIGCVFAMTMIGIAESPIMSKEYMQYYGKESYVYKNTILMLCVNSIIAFVLLNQNYIFDKNLLRKVVYCILCVVVVGDVYYINIDNASNVYRKNGIISNIGADKSIISSASEFLVSEANIEQYRFLVDNYTIEDFNTTPLGLDPNKNIYNQLMSMQSYITFENPAYLNMTGAINGKYITTNSMKSEINSSVLSMFSVKYIVKHKGQEQPVFRNVTGKQMIYENNEPIVVSSKPDAVGIYPINIDIQKGQILLIEGEIKLQEIPDSFITMDLYGSNGYDLVESNEELLGKVSKGNNKFNFMISTGEMDIPEDAMFRICLYDSKIDTDVTIDKLKISLVETEVAQELQAIFEDEDIIIYENKLAKPIIYMPKQVISVDNIEKQINEIGIDENLAETSYIEGTPNMDLTNVTADIDIISIKNNSISAKVVASDNTFINMTQCYYPGWKVYVDGKRSELYKVNNVIQGVEVPQGAHEVEFKYQPTSLYVGMIISICTVVIVLVILIRAKNKV